MAYIISVAREIIMYSLRCISSRIGIDNEYQSSQEDIFILGRRYYLDNDGTIERQDDSGTPISFLSHLLCKEPRLSPEILLDILTRLNFTYRTRFTPIPRAQDGPSPTIFINIFRDNIVNTVESLFLNPDCFSTDIGWGCMIRTGQSLLGNALQVANLGRSFRVRLPLATDSNFDRERKIIGWFQDVPDAPFSVHKFVQAGVELSGMSPGEWFGPAPTSRSIKKLVSDFPECGIDSCIISISSGDIPGSEVDSIFDADKDSTILFLFGVKLGVNSVNQRYRKEIVRMLESKYSVGISGGSPSSSLYFFGHLGSKLLFFDPHRPQPSLRPENFDSCHTSNYGTLEFSPLDPSMLVGFLIRGQDEWMDWKADIRDLQIINVLDKRTDDSGLLYGDYRLESMQSRELLPKENDETSSASSASIGESFIDIARIYKDYDRQQSPSRDDNFQTVDYTSQNVLVLGENDTIANCGMTHFEIEHVPVEQEHEVLE